MADELRGDSESREHERELEKSLARVHEEEEQLENKLDKAQEHERKIEEELDEERHRHRPNAPFFLVFIINGEDFRVETQVDHLLRTAVEQALIESGNTGRQNPSEWEVRDSAGVLLEMAREIRGLGLTDDARLFLSLKVGAGGSDESRS